MQHSLSTNFFHFFATTRLLQYCNSQGPTDQNRLVSARGSRGSLVTVMGWQSRDFFKCLPPLFKSCTSATILPVSQKESTDQIDRLSGPWISIPEDSSPLIKYPNKQKNLLIVFFLDVRYSVKKLATSIRPHGDVHGSTDRRTVLGSCAGHVQKFRRIESSRILQWIDFPSNHFGFYDPRR